MIQSACMENIISTSAWVKELFFLCLCFALKVVNTLLDAFCQTCDAVNSHASESLDLLKR